jgi:hypothetical protein
VLTVPAWLDQQDGRLLFGARAVFDSAWHDEELARVEFDVAPSKLDRQVAVEDEEEVVGLVVFVPDKLASDLDEAQVVAVELPTIFGCQCSWKRLSFSRRLTFSCIPPSDVVADAVSATILAPEVRLA